MAEPRATVQVWVESHFPGARLDPLAGDASTRRFLRIRPLDGRSLVLMDYGAPFDRETDDVRLSRVFRDAALPVAKIRSIVPDPGCLVLDDLGDLTLERNLHEHPSGGRDRLTQAVDLAATIAVRGTEALARSSRAGGPSLDQERFRFEMGFFLEHYVRNHLGHSPDSTLERGLEQLADEAARTPRHVLCHRDFHSRNLMLRDDGSLAMVDIQDARWGPDTYDLASLLYDAYIEIDPEWRAPLVERFRSAWSDPPEPEPFRTRLRIVAAERMIKALGTFGYQVATLRRSRYREPIPRTLRRLNDLLPTLNDFPGLGAALRKNRVLGGPET